MKTPLEVRNQIYQYLLSTKYTKVDFTDEEPVSNHTLTALRYELTSDAFQEYRSEGLSRFPRAFRVYQFHPAILKVNRQTNQEAGHILRENLFVKLTTISPTGCLHIGSPPPLLPSSGLAHFWHGLWSNLFTRGRSDVQRSCTYRDLDLLSNGLRTVAVYANTSWFPYAATEITLDTLERGKFDQRYSYHLFTVDEMTRFCKALMRHESGILSRTSVSVRITGVETTTASISKLLEPLRRLHSLGSVDIVGHVSNEYKSTLIDYIKKLPDVDAVVQKIQETVKKGDRAASSRDYSIAVANYKSAIDDVTDYCKWLWETYTDIFTNGKHSEETYYTIFYDNLLDLHKKLAVIHVELQNYRLAHEWIGWALYETTDPDDQISEESTNVYSIAAQASEGLGMVKRAVEEMRKAVRHQPLNPRLPMELSRLEGKMQDGDGDLRVQK